MVECAKLDECNGWLPLPILTTYPDGGMGSNVEIKINGIPFANPQHHQPNTMGFIILIMDVAHQ
jgi:hypothetical protein